MGGDAVSQPGGGREITLEKMVELRGKTDAISRWLRAELEDRLETLRPLFAPKLLLGEYLRSGERLEAGHDSPGQLRVSAQATVNSY